MSFPTGWLATHELDDWYDGWSDGPFTLAQIKSYVAGGASATQFHVGGKTETYADYLQKVASITAQSRGPQPATRPVTLQPVHDLD